ncbi:MAG: ferritin family protein, partial [Patescibacteria group bacterium]
MKLGSEATPIINQKEEIGEVSRKNLLETLSLERTATALYDCMSGKAEKFEIKAMYRRLAKVELQHAMVVTQLLGMEAPEINPESCSDEMVENFNKTIDLEDTATKLYARFTKEAAEKNVKIFFTALAQV